MSQPKQPHYFHLLWDEDLDDLREVLERIRERRGEVVTLWYELYLLHFGDDRALSEAEFRQIFEPALLRNQDALLRKDMDSYAASVLMTGRQLAERHVPLEEVIAAVHLLEEAAQEVFPKQPPISTDVYNKFDKLSHIRIILLVSAYSRLQSASAATRIHALELEAKNLPPEERTHFHGLVGHSPVMRELYRRIQTLARQDEIVLIVGEAGTGKKLIARALHECGRQQEGTFAMLRCAALPAYLIENELFGYRRQPADEDQTYLGLFAAAEGGTLFLDEITRLPLEVQDRLTRLIERTPAETGYRRVRIIASTRGDPEEAVRVGQLRQDFSRLFADRLLHVPPLRERRGDIALLAGHFIELLNHRVGRNKSLAGIDHAATQLMERYAWPGNVSEFFEAIESAFAAARSATIGPSELPTPISGVNGKAKPLPTISFETFADAERGVLQRALEITGGNKLRAAKLLKISRKKLYSGIAKYGLKSPEP
ncbi:MAG TPA: sigma 54-interacting transcriptional regulator [Candidatus Binataceae bacterium]|nr:sigma 54-interacting transcriptional regulator [Candidatus Binataceae bacterium]